METKPKRPNYQPYVPVHRRKQIAELSLQQPIQQQQQLTQQQQQQRDVTEVKRRGRGQFRAPSANIDEDNHVNDKQIEEVESIKLEQVFEDKLRLDQQPKETKIEEKEEKEEEEEEEEETKIEEEEVMVQVEKEDWEDLIDEDEEKLVIKPSKNNNKVEKTEPAVIELDEKMLEDLTTVLDCYDFPNTFKTHHLQGIFREYEKLKGGYQIKWMDDTRALIIFEHPTTAKKAYIDLLSSSLVKVKPYKGQIEIKPTGPVPRRPVTTDMVARRLVHGALGVRTVKTSEQRAAERELLQAARDQRELNRMESQRKQKEVSNAFDE